MALDYMQDINGNHVVQLALTLLSHPENEFIYAEVAANCMTIAKHKHGCCVLQKCLDHGNARQQVEAALIG